MSRIAKKPILIPKEIKVKIDKKKIIIKNINNKFFININKLVKIEKIKNKLIFRPYKENKNSWLQSGTIRSIVNNSIIGITKGFTKKLKVIGIGYKISVKNNIINLFVGYSHSIIYKLPKDVSAICPSQNEIIFKSINKQSIGQVAANIRFYKKPEPYKGKGIRYDNEIVYIKETKKK
ncbi:50S ribosomal protein L6 [Candidatus Annandia adelgestsuga]|uniref:50S ribosomal protein L6 n=1 Tax=Candidatus Annandia adelgestsuga TaxID=1302411 RepID=A0A3S9J7I2_9ENTR|nr:50S ribosomal protein L6 [Candidatus Annandia adelgestsuga]AZP36207.1 50S ribosomal protein L6 [Candidatus Annandia adelgestsuga]